MTVDRSFSPGLVGAVVPRLLLGACRLSPEREKNQRLGLRPARRPCLASTPEGVAECRVKAGRGDSNPIAAPPSFVRGSLPPAQAIRSPLDHQQITNPVIEKPSLVLRLSVSLLQTLTMPSVVPSLRFTIGAYRRGRLVAMNFV